MAADYGMETDKLKELMTAADREQIERNVKINKAVELIMDNVKESAKAKKKDDTPKEEAENND
jgi:trigger factor